MNHLHDWRHYAQEKEVFPEPAPSLNEMLLAMRNRPGSRPSDRELANERRRNAIGDGSATTKPVVLMNIEEFRQTILSCKGRPSSIPSTTQPSTR